VNRKWFEVVVAGTFSFVSTVALAQPFTTKYLKGTVTSVSVPSFPPSTTTITESTDTTTIDDSVNCGGYSGSSFYRAFSLTTFPSLDRAKFRLLAVTFGVFLVRSDDGGPTLPMTVNVYSTSATPPKLASLTLLDSVSFSLPDSGATTYTVVLPHQPVMTVATDTLVVEVFYINNATNNSTFFIGGNDAGQSAPTYERAPDCFGFEDITDVASLGAFFDQFSLLMLVNGVTEDPTPVRLQSFDVE